MKPPKRILCPFDFSDGSERALEHAVSLAERVGASVHLLHVVPIPTEFAPPMVAVSVATNDQLERALESLQRVARPYEKRAPVTCEVLRGIPADEIAQVPGDADMVVMGTHGRSGWKRWVLGSVTENVIRAAEVPVLAVPPEPPASVAAAP